MLLPLGVEYHPVLPMSVARYKPVVTYQLTANGNMVMPYSLYRLAFSSLTDQFSKA